MDYFNNPEMLSEALKKVSFEQMAAAWNAFDQAMEVVEEKSQWDLALRRLATALDHGIRSLSVLYSGNPDEEGKPEIVIHLIRERHPCFRGCDPKLPNQINAFRDRLSRLGGKALKKELGALARRVETLLRSVESYNFHLRKTVYYTKAAYARDTRRLRFAGRALFAFILIIGLLTIGYRHEKPIQEYVTKGQLFWLTHPEALETEETSLRFKVFGDGEFHDYKVEAVEPISLVALRLDPCDEKNARVWIDAIEIHTRDGGEPLFFSFNEETESWYSQHDTMALKVKAGSLYIRTTGRDPAIRIDSLALNEVVAFRIRMKVVLYKSFVQWIFS